MFHRSTFFTLGALAGAVLAMPAVRNRRKLRVGDDHMKTIGLIGGTSWHSTIEYYRHLNKMTNDHMGPGINPPLLMYSLNVDLMRRGNWEEINNAYLHISRTLQEDGADAILICANTPHKVFPFVQPKLDIPILHIADATASEAQSLGLKKLGLLGTKPVTGHGFIQERIREVTGIETIVPERDDRNQMHLAIATKLTRGIFDDETKELFLRIMDKLKTRGAEGIILGCTELPMLFEGFDYVLPLLDTTRLHARMAVDFILSEVQESQEESH